jgi:hypothetical protein
MTKLEELNAAKAAAWDAYAAAAAAWVAARDAYKAELKKQQESADDKADLKKSEETKS